jgi:hypothetical protein
VEEILVSRIRPRMGVLPEGGKKGIDGACKTNNPQWVRQAKKSATRLLLPCALLGPLAPWRHRSFYWGTKTRRAKQKGNHIPGYLTRKRGTRPSVTRKCWSGRLKEKTTDFRRVRIILLDQLKTREWVAPSRGRWLQGRDSVTGPSACNQRVRGEVLLNPM